MAEIVPMQDADPAWLEETFRNAWGSTRVAIGGKLYELMELQGLVARCAGEACGVLTYCIQADACLLISLNSTREGIGIGSTLLKTLAERVRQAGCTCIRTITTNDNLRALHLYQKLGFRLIALHPGAVDSARQLKPEIPGFGLDGIPIRDEIELELAL